MILRPEASLYLFLPPPPLIRTDICKRLRKQLLRCFVDKLAMLKPFLTITLPPELRILHFCTFQIGSYTAAYFCTLFLYTYALFCTFLLTFAHFCTPLLLQLCCTKLCCNSLNCALSTALVLTSWCIGDKGLPQNTNEYDFIREPQENGQTI